MEMSVYEEIPMCVSSARAHSVYMNPYIETPDVKEYELWSGHRYSSEAVNKNKAGNENETGNENEIVYQTEAENENEARCEVNEGYNSDESFQDVTGDGESSVSSAYSDLAFELNGDRRNSNYSFAAEPAREKEETISESSEHTYFILEPTSQRVDEKTMERHNEDSSTSSSEDYETLRRKLKTDPSDKDSERGSEDEEDYEELKLKRNSLKPGHDAGADDGYERPLSKMDASRRFKTEDDLQES